MLQPFTRDTYGIAVKSTFGETKGKQFTIFKDPKTDTGKFKKSQKGYCFVYEKDDNEITYIDDLYEFHPVIEIGKSIKNNLLQTVFKDGDLIKEYSLKEIRNKLHNNEF
jgi:nicotinamide phosphoribosyltransferase